MSKYDVGYLGGGQLARMSIQAAQRMGLKCLSLDPGGDTPASQIADNIVGALDDVNAVSQVFRNCERVTLENEFIPAQAIEEAMRGTPGAVLTPSTNCLAIVQDKLRQRMAYTKHGVAAPRAVSMEEDVIAGIGFPMVLKARFGGYDGKGTRYAHNEQELKEHEPLWSQGNWLAEQFVPFKREVAVIVCRSATQTMCFPTMETVQTNHVCDLVFPAHTDARDTAIKAVESVDGYGLFGVELFETKDGEFLVNEIAPRPHNTGHYTLDWGGVSQFEAHVRLVLGLPLPSLAGGDVCMANLLGQPGAGDFHLGVRAAIEADPAVYVHWYGKAEARSGRKMGHINAVGKDCVARAEEARRRFYRAWSNP